MIVTECLAAQDIGLEMNITPMLLVIVECGGAQAARLARWHLEQPEQKQHIQKRQQHGRM